MACACGTFCLAQRGALPELGAPPQGEAQWIARSMRMNGLPMTLKAFESRLVAGRSVGPLRIPAEISGSHEVRRSVNSPWQVLVFKSPDYFITVHARPAAAGSEGTIGEPRVDLAVLRRLVYSIIDYLFEVSRTPEAVQGTSHDARRAISARRSGVNACAGSAMHPMDAGVEGGVDGRSEFLGSNGCPTRTGRHMRGRQLPGSPHLFRGSGRSLRHGCVAPEGREGQVSCCR